MAESMAVAVVKPVQLREHDPDWERDQRSHSGVQLMAFNQREDKDREDNGARVGNGEHSSKKRIAQRPPDNVTARDARRGFGSLRFSERQPMEAHFRTHRPEAPW